MLKLAASINPKALRRTWWAPWLVGVALWLRVCSQSCAATESPAAEYLTDIPERLSETQQGWGVLGTDTSAHANGVKPLPLQIENQAYTKGLGHHANGEITVDLAGRYETFEAEVGVQSQPGKIGSVAFQVFVDDQKMFDSGVMKGIDAARPVRVSVAGAEELRLVVMDAGDGIYGDAANWANARLTRNPAMPSKPTESRAEIAPFARVVSSDPTREQGTAAKRNEAIPAADVFLEAEVRSDANGNYPVTVWPGGVGCIGLKWDELRTPRELGLQFSDSTTAPALDSIRLESWVGESPWQGAWKPLLATGRNSDGRYIWQISTGNLVRMQKVRWIFPGESNRVAVKTLSATASWSWKTADIRIESERPGKVRTGQIKIYNGYFVDPRDGGNLPECRWDSRSPLRVKVRYSRPRTVKVDRTVLRFDLMEGACAVAIEDLLTNEAVYVPEAGLFITLDPAPITLHDYLKRVAGRKSVLQEVREQPDQTFSRAMAVVHDPIQDRGPMLVSLACDNRKFTVHRDGAISFVPGDAPDGTYPELSFAADSNVPITGEPPLWWQLVPRFGSGKNEVLERHLDGGWLPKPVTSVKENGIVYSQCTYVAPVDRRAVTDGPDWLCERAVCVADYRIENVQPHDAGVALSLTLSRKGTNSEPVNFDPVKGGFRITQADRLLALVETGSAETLAVRNESGKLHFAGQLPAGGSARLVVYLPAWKLNPSKYAELLNRTNWPSEVEDYWNKVLGSAMQVETPDLLLNNVIRASQVHCLLAARNEERGRRVAVWPASDRYGVLESESHAVIRGLDMTGCGDFARRGLDYFVKRYNQEGFLTTGYTVVGTGEHLWTLAEHFQRSKNTTWFRQIAPEVVRVCQWIVAQRAKTKGLDARGERVPEYGLMPPGVSADWSRYDYRFFNDAQYWAGLDGAARALAQINHTAAAVLQEDARQYREDILRAYRWTQARSPVIQLNTGAWVSYYPSLLNCFGNIDGFLPGEDVGRTWAYSIELGAHHLAVTGVLDPCSEETTRQINHLEDVQFLRSGMFAYPEEQNHKDRFSYGGFSKVQPYYTRIAEIYAQRDDIKPFIRSYFNAMASLLSKENLSFWEHFRNTAAWNKTHETGWFLCQTRIMLVMERGDELWLAPFVTDQWLQDGMSVGVTNAPTKFGTVSYHIQSNVKNGMIEARIEPPARSVPGALVLRLRHPAGKAMRAVTVNDRPHTDFHPENETIRILPEAATPITVRASY